jgi:Cu2+-exporting ATPase
MNSDHQQNMGDEMDEHKTSHSHDDHGSHDHSTNAHDEHKMDRASTVDHTTHTMDHTPPQEHTKSAEDHEHHVDHYGHEQMFRSRFWVSILISIPVLLYSPFIQNIFNFTMPDFTGSEWITPIFSIIIFFYGGLPFLKMAVPEVRNRRPGMMMLISLAISVAFFYSLAALFFLTSDTFFWELVTLIDIMLLGHWLEMRSVRQASGALDELAKLMPDTAERINPSGEVEEVRINELKAGDLVLVRPGASVPADGQVVEGDSDVNEAMITGESKPVSKEPGDQVIGGSINGDGSLRVRVQATGEETALAGIMRLVEEAQQSKSNTQILADKAAGWLFYIAIGVAVITAIAWTVAVPLVVAITTAMGAKNGILVRDRLALEEAREIDIVIFDKTGTLTKGEFGVVEIATVDGWTEDRALAFAAAIEGDSEHTIARGIRSSAQERGLELPVVTDFEAIKGRGVQALSNGHKVYIGGPRLLEMLELSLQGNIGQFALRVSEKGQSVVHLVEENQVVASFALADVIRPESNRAIDRLHEMEIEVAMLTGDSKAVAETVAEELGIDRYFAEVLPEHKDQKVIELQQQGKKVAMVGDGVNDAPALTRADVGIAIGSGTDVAIESAGIILVKSNPLDVVKIFSLSRASYRKMIQNLIWATGYNVVALPLAAGVLAPIGVLLSPAIGALFMSLSTVIVAINAQLMRRQEIAA